MTIDELFLFTLDDLKQRADLGNGEYDALQIAALQRKLFLNGGGSLVAQVNRSRRLDLRFTVNSETPSPGIIGWHPFDTFHPNPEWECMELIARSSLRAAGTSASAS